MAAVKDFVLPEGSPPRRRSSVRVETHATFTCAGAEAPGGRNSLVSLDILSRGDSLPPPPPPEAFAAARRPRMARVAWPASRHPLPTGEGAGLLPAVGQSRRARRGRGRLPSYRFPHRRRAFADVGLLGAA